MLNILLVSDINTIKQYALTQKKTILDNYFFWIHKFQKNNIPLLTWQYDSISWINEYNLMIKCRADTNYIINIKYNTGIRFTMYCNVVNDINKIIKLLPIYFSNILISSVFKPNKLYIYIDSSNDINNIKCELFTVNNENIKTRIIIIDDKTFELLIFNILYYYSYLKFSI
jgi:hypothetical protein